MAAECSPERKPGDRCQQRYQALEEGDRDFCRPYGAYESNESLLPRAYARGYHSSAR